ncbi:MAG TPA: hypothetical protein DIS79_03545 [Bacteroidetes bacterium]|nr:hypothetical protein [Bacteroidota bacterium]HRK03762.1 VIT domain-containing protein [Chlorobiota bacterium]
MNRTSLALSFMAAMIIVPMLAELPPAVVSIVNALRSSDSTEVRTLPQTERPQIRRTSIAPQVFLAGDDGNIVPMKIQSIAIDVSVRGTLATTTYDMTVKNPHNRVLEGEFEMPVGDGRTVSRFGLDINGKLREAVVVRKELARSAFEEIVRRKVDPALIEQTIGNTFRTRIYPIPARGTRRVVIAVEQELRSSTAGFEYDIALDYSDVDTFAFHLDVDAFASRPSLTGAGVESVSLTPRGRYYTTSFRRYNTSMQGMMTLGIPITAGSLTSTVTSWKSKLYAAAWISVNPSLTERATPRTITLLWDASLSARTADRDLEFAVLDGYFRTLNNVRVDLVAFSNDVRPTRQFTIRNGNWSDLRMALSLEPDDGATQLGSLPLSTLRTDLAIIVSDGVSTFGKHIPPPSRVPTYTMSSSPKTHHVALTGIAEPSGGLHLNLATTDSATAVRALQTVPLRVESIDVVSGRVDSLTRPQSITGNTLTISGILVSPTAEIAVRFAQGSLVTSTETISLSSSTLDTNTAAARLFARHQLQLLERDRFRNEEAIADIGMNFSVVTSATSLIVLELASDYAKHGIEPPTNEPELVREYAALRQRAIEDAAFLDSLHSQTVRQLVAQHRKWLTKQFDTSNRVYSTQSGTAEATSARESARNDQTRARIARDKVASALSLQPGIRAEGKGSFDIRGSRTTETQVLVEGLEVTDTVVGGLLGDVSNISMMMPSPYIDYEVTEEVIGLDSKDDRVSGENDRTVVKPADRETGLPRTYSDYLQHRPQTAALPMYYLAVADSLHKSGQRTEALRVASNLAELASEDAGLLRVLGHRLRQWSMYDVAVMVFDDVRRIRGEEPQSWRDLALAYDGAGHHQDAVNMLYAAAQRRWDGRFPEIELILLTEMNHIIGKHRKQLQLAHIDTSMYFDVTADVRVVLSWDTDNTDIDLWVTDPTGEQCYYANPRTQIGGRLSRDLTGGYGPEEFFLRTAIRGQYAVQFRFFSNSQQRISGPTLVTVDVYRNYGRPNETRETRTFPVSGVSQMVDVNAITH